MIIFESLLATLEASIIFVGRWEQMQKIGLSPKPNHQNQVKLVQIVDTHCRIVQNFCFLFLFLYFYTQEP